MRFARILGAEHPAVESILVGLEAPALRLRAGIQQSFEAVGLRLVFEFFVHQATQAGPLLPNVTPLINARRRVAGPSSELKSFENSWPATTRNKRNGTA